MYESGIQKACGKLDSRQKYSGMTALFAVPVGLGIGAFGVVAFHKAPRRGTCALAQVLRHKQYQDFQKNGDGPLRLFPFFFVGHFHRVAFGCNAGQKREWYTLLYKWYI